eukprot:CAMPEP_0177543950 /NCGR_PEP_ID=MMETSP0369-20130122/61715_1 /TAXON_ID=447022 ORGANISM="Scrippsiella hangoei-like, Strain SHHI-4" /NCGR_SAMPLE_ID=MMETSP0369 /ASSEMBLY_ACC=CAM_ASM_000364 /LENGTH=275 /DNA_ID=CAMNT_0019027925 /DNA_START=79 /DNA_END=907 /DNA_ORIENTATION=-
MSSCHGCVKPALAAGASNAHCGHSPFRADSPPWRHTPDKSLHLAPAQDPPEGQPAPVSLRNLVPEILVFCQVVLDLLVYGGLARVQVPAARLLRRKGVEAGHRKVAIQARPEALAVDDRAEPLRRTLRPSVELVENVSEPTMGNLGLIRASGAARILDPLVWMQPHEVLRTDLGQGLDGDRVEAAEQVLGPVWIPLMFFEVEGLLTLRFRRSHRFDLQQLVVFAEIQEASQLKKEATATWSSLLGSFDTSSPGRIGYAHRKVAASTGIPNRFRLV